MNQYLVEAANIIVGPSRHKPNWLDNALEKQTRRIQIFREMEAHAPQRSVIKEQLAEFRDAARTLRKGLNDPILMSFVGRNFATDAVSESAFQGATDELSLMADSALLRLCEKPKVPLAYPLDDKIAVSAYLLCAFSVRHLIRFARSTRSDDGRIVLPPFVGPDNPDAQAAANSLWQASGGAILGSLDGNRPPTGWRHHLIAAKAAEDARDARSAWLAIEAELIPSIPLPSEQL